jgi:hypothetical protein
MFTEVLRVTPTQDVGIGNEAWSRTRTMFKDFAASMQRYVILEGRSRGDHMVVIRFYSREDFNTAHDTVAEQWAALIKFVNEGGYIIQEVMLLDEILEPVTTADLEQPVAEIEPAALATREPAGEA